MDPIDQFSVHLVSKGYQVDNIIADGQIHRFNLEGRKDMAGWYLFTITGDRAFGVCGDWVSQTKHPWSSNGRQISRNDREKFKAELKKVKHAREAEIKTRYKLAANKAAAIWEKAKPATNDHPYLKAKGVLSYNLRQGQDDRLIIAAAP